MKRFYNDVAVAASADGWQVELDGRGVRSQAKRLPQAVPSEALARLLAKEWEEQGETIAPERFVMRDLADYAIDVVASDREGAIARLLPYAETDTLCYRAEPDEPLYRRQVAVWNPLLDRLQERHGIALKPQSGIVHKPQDAAMMAKAGTRLSSLGAFELAAAETMAPLAASLTIALLALEPDADIDKLWNAAELEEAWQREQWGADAEAERRSELRREAFVAAARFAAAARSAD